MRSYKIVRNNENRFACQDMQEGHIIGGDYDAPDDAYRESCKLLRKMNVEFEISLPVILFD